MRAPRWLDRLLSLVFPKTCVVCRAVVACDDLWCGSCAPPRKTGELCPRCGHLLRDCCCSYTGGEWSFTRAIAPFWYTDDLRLRLLDLKKRPDPRLCAYLADAMCKCLGQYFSPRQFQLVAPVPASPDRMAETRRNHAEDLAASVADELGLPLLPHVLERLPASKMQHHLNWRERFQNARGSFGLRNGTDLLGKHVLVVDDIFTTGATAHYCAELLRKAGAKSVTVLTASTTKGKKVEIM